MEYIDPEKLAGIRLDHGAHSTREMGLCLMEAVSFLAGEMHSDHPECVSRILTSFGISINDRCTNDLRQQLIPLIPSLIGTRSDGLDEERRKMVINSSVVQDTCLCGTPFASRLQGRFDEVLQFYADLIKVPEAKRCN